jgi:hypothetical protein
MIQGILLHDPVLFLVIKPVQTGCAEPGSLKPHAGFREELSATLKQGHQGDPLFAAARWRLRFQLEL